MVLRPAPFDGFESSSQPVPAGKEVLELVPSSGESFEDLDPQLLCSLEVLLCFLFSFLPSVFKI